MYLYELQRARYVLKAYLRVRLQKIEKYASHVLDSNEMHQRLSPKELQYAQVGGALCINIDQTVHRLIRRSMQYIII